MSKEKNNKKAAEKKPTPSPAEIIKMDTEQQTELQKAQAVIQAEKKRKLSAGIELYKKFNAELNAMGCGISSRGGWLGDKFSNEIIVIVKE